MARKFHLFNPCNPCCTTGVTCNVGTCGSSHCNGISPLKWTLQFAGITNNTCTDCSHLTVPITLTLLGGTCHWGGSVTPGVGCFGGGDTPVPVDLFGGTNWDLVITLGSGLLNVVYGFVADGAWNCCAPNTLPFLSQGSFGGPACNGWPATVTVTPSN